MGTSVQVSPLCGVYNENPLSYLVSIDGFNFLLDCGWNDLFDPSLLEPLSRVASTIDAVLLSHPDTLHLGALPYAMKQLGLSAPVYATEPVHRLGLLTMYDQYLSRKQVSDFDLFTLDDIDSAFQNVIRLTFSQNYHLSGKGEGIVIAPHVAGHMLGGSIWKITKDGEEVVYAVDYNHRKESTIDYVKSFLEWMSDSISKSFETSRDNAFLLRHVTLLINKTDLDNAPPGPKVGL
ncbi:Cleavage and polyadenylation specificity factor subunit 2 [Raphanus sativus]|nr:Cleavage and polyadenylation specificity factor subunit 2 [Raphanus sativus]